MSPHLGSPSRSGEGKANKVARGAPTEGATAPEPISGKKASRPSEPLLHCEAGPASEPRGREGPKLPDGKVMRTSGSVVIDNGGSELRRTARGGVAYTSGILITSLLQFAFAVIAARSLSQSAVGALLEAISLFTICSTTLGADVGLVRFVPIYLSQRPQDVPRLFAVALLPALLGSIVLAIPVFVYAPQLTHVFFHKARDNATTSELRVLALFLPTATLAAVTGAGIRPWSNRIAVLIQSFLIAIGRVVLLGLFVLLGVTLSRAAMAYALPVAASLLMACAVLSVRVRRAKESAPDAKVSSYASIASQFWRFSSLGFFGLISQTLIISLDVVLVGAFLSTRLAGAYSVASRYLLIGTFALQAIIQSVSPQMSRLVNANDFKGVEVVYKSATWWSIAAGWPPLLVLATFAPFFQSIFGHGYVVAAPALTILALAMLANVGTGPNGTVVQMSGRSGVNLAVWGIGAALNVGLNVWLIPIIGLEGAAVAWLATILSTSLLFNAILWRNFRLEPFGHGYWLTAGASLGCYGVLGLIARLSFGTGIGSFLAYVLISSLLYVGLMFRWRRELHFDAFESLYKRLLPTRRADRVDDQIQA